MITIIITRIIIVVRAYSNLYNLLIQHTLTSLCDMVYCVVKAFKLQN